MMYEIFITILIILTSTTIYFLIFKKKEKKEYFVNFMTKEETKEFLLKDNDFYIDMLSKADLRARLEETNEGYKKKVLEDVVEINDKERFEILCKRADEWLKEYKSKYLKDNHNIDKIKWNIAVTKGYYENGLPHTRGKIIFLPSKIELMDDKNIIGTLIHEKIHIYQRYNREEIDKNLELLGYTKKKHKSKEDLIRSNPDTNEYIYTNTNGEEMYFKYYNEEPLNITDGIIYGKEEHPYEMISYEIENDYMNK